MGGWNRDVDRNRDVLERIVALLVSLASLADLASGLPFLRRRQVLAIQIHGEAEGRAFVAGMAPGRPTMTDEEQADEAEQADDAAHLAARLRVLALALYAILSQAGRSALPGVGPRAGQRNRAGQARTRGTMSVAPDTS